MEVAYTLTVEDLKAFVKYNQKRGPGAQNGVKIALRADAALLVVTIGLGVIGVFTISWDKGFVARNVPYFMCMIVIAVICWLTHLFIRAETQHVLKSLSEFRVVLTSEGVHRKTPTAESIYFWVGVPAIGVTDEHLFIYIDQRQAIVVPARAFPDSNVFNAFVDQTYAYLEADSASHYFAGTPSPKQAFRDELGRRNDFRTTTTQSPSVMKPKP